MGPLYLGKMGTFANFRYINNLAMISTSVLSTLHIMMNPNMNYYLVITDSKLQATSNNLDLVPRTAIILEKNAGTANIVLKEIIIKNFHFCVK